MQTPTAVPALVAIPTAPVPAPARGASGRRPLIVLQLFLAVFFLVGALSEWREARMLHAFRPVAARVLSSTVERVGDGPRSGDSWRPVVRYAYVVGGERRVSDRVTPLRESRGARWAFDITRLYVAGTPTTAYYDPADPDQAFLLRRRSWLPWVFMLMPLAMLAAARWVENRRGRSRR